MSTDGTIVARNSVAAGVGDPPAAVPSSIAPSLFGHVDLWTPSAYRSAGRYQWVDLARGIGCGLVILAHCGFGRFGWFWWIMDLFFVASGLLITRTMIHLSRRERPLLEFFVFRASRLFPALLLLYGSYALAGVVLGLEDPPSDILPYILIYQNTDFYISAKEIFPRIREFDHLWSIVIEEHYYLFWGTFGLLFFMKNVNYRTLFTLAGALLLVAMTYRFFGGHPWTILARLDAFVIGSMMAVFVFADKPVGPFLASRKKQLYGAYLAFVVFSFFWMIKEIVDFNILFSKDNEPPKFPEAFWFDVLVYSVLCSYIVLLLMSLDARGVQPNFFAKTVIYFGSLSYEAYLFHFPIIWALRKYASFDHIDNVLIRYSMALAVTFAAAAIVNRFVTIPGIAQRKRLYAILNKALPPARKMVERTS